MNIKRLYHLIKNDILANYKSILIAIGAVTGTLLLINISSIASSEYWNLHNVFYPICLLLGGYIVTSLAFNDINNPQKGYTYLLLPSSNMEKFLSKLLLTSAGYVFISLLIYFLYSVLASLITFILFGLSHPVFSPFDFITIKIIGIYLVTQSIFLFGSIYFRRLAFIKSLLALVVFGLSIGAVSMFFVYIFYLDLFYGKGMIVMPWQLIEDILFHSEILISVIQNVFIFLLWFVLAPYFWILTFLRLKEKEAQHEIPE